MKPALQTKPSKTVAIIQARLGSRRLPEKVLQEIAGHPMLWHVVKRVERCREIDLIVVATSNEAKDYPIAEFCKCEGILCFQGSESDVLDRYYQAAMRDVVRL